MKLKVDGMGEAIQSLNKMISLLFMAIVSLALALLVRS